MSSNEDFFEQIADLRREGYSYMEACELSVLETRINNWPEEWGNSIKVILYGSIFLNDPLEFKELGISVSNEINQNSRFTNSYTATIRVKERSAEEFFKAIAKLEDFLSSWHITNWGNCSIHYWCFILAENTDCGGYPNENDIMLFLKNVEKLPQKIKILVLQAAWWLRNYKNSTLSGNGMPQVFTYYMGLWNALENLVKAICLIHPVNKISEAEKNNLIKKRLIEIGKDPTVKDISEMYLEIINPGFRVNVENALKCVFGEKLGKQYYHEIYLVEKDKRLAQIRNDIDHGNITETKLENRLRVQTGAARLRLIVLNMLLKFGGLSLISDPQVKTCNTCFYLDNKKYCSLSQQDLREIFWNDYCNHYSKR